MTRRLGGAASSCCAPLVDGPPQELRVVHRSRSAWQLADGSGRVALCLADRTAVRLPHALTVPELLCEPAAITVGSGSLAWAGVEVRVTRWWAPATPRHPELLERVNDGAADAITDRWPDLLGLGEGLTPYGDDVLCGALVTLLAAGHPAGRRLAEQVRAADLEGVTTATSAALLRHAAGGRCIDELAGYLTSYVGQLEPTGEVAAYAGQLEPTDEVAASAGDREPTHQLAAYASRSQPTDVATAASVLRGVGHTSGTGLIEGVRRIVGQAATSPAAAA